MRRQKEPGRTSGFSVLELLVVMAIISTLTMIVIPTYRNWSVKTRAAAVSEQIHNIDLGVAQFVSTTGEYPEADGFGFSPWGKTPTSLTSLLKDSDFLGPGEITLAYWYVEPPRRHGPPQLRRPPHAFHGQGLHLGWADNNAPSPTGVTGSGPNGGAPDVPPSNVQPPGETPPGDRPPDEKPDNPVVEKPGEKDGTNGAQPSQGSGSTDGSTPVIFGGPTGTPGDCDPAIYDDCGPGQPLTSSSTPQAPPRIGYIAVHAPNAEGEAVLRRLMQLFPSERVRPLGPGPDVILVLLQE